MADVNRCWVSMDLGNFNVGKKQSLFVGGDNPDEVRSHLVAFFGEPAADNIIGHFSDLTTEDAFDNLKAGGLVGANSPASSPTQAKTDGPVCKHGPRVYKSGMKNGKAWAGWMCDTPQNAPDKCKPEWA
jgi:hypothetical protein